MLVNLFKQRRREEAIEKEEGEESLEGEEGLEEEEGNEEEEEEGEMEGEEERYKSKKKYTCLRKEEEGSAWLGPCKWEAMVLGLGVESDFGMQRVIGSTGGSSPGLLQTRAGRGGEE
ncbi:hypothetical protein M5K25_020970 [Dendrobium thyrsiflorum]|uniref:Uncharacterized protein n=1 Tax=Dendrobium thyrsiflorum TaxID=117978 RepID=A0ABD0UBF9_DENTH